MNAATAGITPVARIGWMDWLRRELEPFPGRDATTARIVVTVALVVVISMSLQVPEASLSAYMVFFATKENKVITALTGVLLIVGVTFAIAASLLVYRFTFDHPELRIPAMAVVLFVGFFLSRVFVIGPLAFGAAFVFAATQSIAELMPSAEYLVHSLLWLWVAVSYPIALTVVVNQVMLPANPYPALVRELQRRLDATIGLIERMLGLAAADQRADRSLQELAARGSSALFKMLKLAEIAEPSLKRRHAAQNGVILAIERMVAASAALSLPEREALTPDDRRRLEALRAAAARARTELPQPSLTAPVTEIHGDAGALPEIMELERAVASLNESLKGEAARVSNAAGQVKPRKGLLAADAFSNPAHAHFALKVTLAAMVCYILYTAVDWAGIHTAFITCCFISLENTGATLRKGALRFAGCAVGGLLGFLSILYLIPQMESITSLVLLVAAASALAGWVGAGSERIAYAGLQIALAFYMCVLQGYAPDTDFDNIRNRLVGIVLGIAVTTLVFRYVWPERAVDRLCEALARALRSIARLIDTPQAQTSLESAKAEATSLRARITAGIDEALRLAEVAPLEEDEPGPRGWSSTEEVETLISRTADVFLTASLLANEAALSDWQRLPDQARRAESELRSKAAMRLDQTADFLLGSGSAEQTDLESSVAWTRAGAASPPQSPDEGRTALLERLARQAQRVGQPPKPR